MSATLMKSLMNPLALFLALSPCMARAAESPQSAKAAIPKPDAKDLDVEILRTVTVFEAKEHLNFPWIFRGPGKFLSLACSTGLHTKTERGMRLISTDDGDTWTKPTETPVGGMGTLLPDGRAVVLSCWGPEPNPNGSYPTTTLFYTDGGRKRVEAVAGTLTWPLNMKPHFHRNILQMPDGSLIATIYGRQDGHKKYTSALIRTEDGGKRWTLLSIIAHSEQVGGEGFCEPAMVRLTNGDLFCAMRTGGPLYTTRSTNGGRTWSTPVVVADHGVDPDLLLMENGVLALSYGRPNVDLRFSADGTGLNWSPPMTLYRGPGCSYTSLVEGANHDLLAFFSQSGFCGTPGTGPLNMMRMARLSVRRK
ncbi:MAG: exo-alpha-sialidase [Phycisphaerae bacterium]|nr:exo-alpha-sialidase [Phycisphaerae bacterium]